MQSNKELFIKAFMEAERIKYADYQNEDDFDVEFSEKFKQKMQKLISKDNRIKMPTRRRITRALLAAIIAVIVMFSGLMSVSATRTKIIEFVETVKSHYVNVELSDESQPAVETIETAYTLTNLPEGYKQTSYQQDENLVFAVWSNDDNGEIVFFQNIVDTNFNIDNEHNYQKIVMDDKVLYFSNSNSDSSIIWHDEFYIYQINSDALDKDELIELSKNISKK